MVGNGNLYNFLWCPTFSKITNDICEIHVSEDVSIIHYVVGKLTTGFMVMHINDVILKLLLIWYIDLLHKMFLQIFFKQHILLSRPKTTPALPCPALPCPARKYMNMNTKKIIYGEITASYFRVKILVYEHSLQHAARDKKNYKLINSDGIFLQSALYVCRTDQ